MGAFDKSGVSAENAAKNVKEITSEIIKFSTAVENVAQLNAVDRGMATKEEYIEFLKSHVTEVYGIKENDAEGKMDKVIDGFKRFMWSYYILDPLISDPDISDIRIIAYNQIYYKKNGRRSRYVDSFKDKEDYDRFIERIALKNSVNLSDQNAIQIFTDQSQEGWKLRFNISTKFITNSRCAYLHIRKHATKKYTINQLVEDKKMLTRAQADYLINLMETNQSILFCGSGGTGKTTLLNTLLEYINNRSIYCIQESDELFMEKECEFMNYHVVRNRGEGKINYDLKDLAPYALVDDIDTFVIGEIKGPEALDFLTTIYTGATGYGSVHAPSEEDAYTRIADLVKRVSDYNIEEVMFMLRYIDNVVFMKDYQIAGLSKAIWNNDTKQFEFKKIEFGSEES